MELYKVTGKQFDGYRELDPGEAVKNLDRVVPIGVKILSNGTTNPPSYLQGMARFWQIQFHFLEFNIIKPILAKDFIDTCNRKYLKQLGANIVTKRYSIWRKKLTLTRRDWQDQPLPLP